MGELTVGLGLFTGQRAPTSTHPPYEDALHLAVAAEQSGFDTFWVSEHHGWDDDYVPAPLVLLGAVAGVTHRIRLGTGLALAPLAHPVALAEQAAVVDQLSGGRLTLGLGLGYVGREYEAFGVPKAGRGRRLELLLSFLREAWAGESASWVDADGRAHVARVRPTPHGGTIPIWLGGYAPRALARAGRLADGYLAGRGDPKVLADAVTAIATERGVPADEEFTFGVNLVTILEDETTSGAPALAALERQQRAYEAVQRRDDPFSGRVRLGGERDALALGSVDRYVHARGAPSSLVASLCALLEPVASWPRVHVVLRALFPEVDVEAQVERIERLGAEVLPHLRAEWTERHGS